MAESDEWRKATNLAACAAPRRLYYLFDCGITVLIEIGSTMTTRVTQKGQVTIPKPVRDRLGIVTGSEVEFTLDQHGQVVMAKAGAKPKPNRFEALRGIGGRGPTTAEIMALLRGED